MADETLASWRQAVAWAAERLRAGGHTETPDLDAQLLLGFATGASRVRILSHGETSLSDEQRMTFTSLVARRAEGEPVAYLVGEREFMGLRLKTDRRALIPRPETELLVEGMLAALRERETQLARPMVVADIGTGTGAIALALASGMPSLARVYATDLSPDALALARENAAQLGLDARITFLEGDLLAPLPERVDALVANLPYVARRDESSLPVGVRGYEPALALYGDEDGLAAYQRFFADAPAHCQPGAIIGVEFGYNQRTAIQALARGAFPRARVRVGADYAGWDRYVVAWTEPAQEESRAQ